MTYEKDEIKRCWECLKHYIYKSDMFADNHCRPCYDLWKDTDFADDFHINHPAFVAGKFMEVLKAKKMALESLCEDEDE